MKHTYFQVKTFSMAAIALTMLAAVAILAGLAIPAQAQTYPLAFPHPTTFLLNNDVSGSVSDVQVAAVGDFNGDHMLDVAVWGLYAPGNTSEVTIFLGNGNGTFTMGGTYAAPNSTDFNPGSNSLFVADFNGDGKLDLAALTPYNGVFI